MIQCLDCILDDRTQTYGLVLELLELGSVKDIQVRSQESVLRREPTLLAEAAARRKAAPFDRAEHRGRLGDRTAVPARTKGLPSRHQGRQRSRRRRLHRQGAVIVINNYIEKKMKFSTLIVASYLCSDNQ